MMPSSSRDEDATPPTGGGGGGGRGDGSASLMITNRLKTELAELHRDHQLYSNITAGPSGDEDLLKWTATIQGPPDSPYEGGLFFLDISIPTTYPFTPPKIRFKTKIYHCNIGDHGAICLDILTKDAWTPALTIPSALLSISSLLCDPNPEDPLMGDIADQYENNRVEHDRMAKEWTQKYAVPK